MKKSILALFVLLSLSGCDKDIIKTTITGENGDIIHVIFYDNTANITLPDDNTVLLKGIPIASGTKYANDEYEYSEWHGEIELKKNNETIFRAKNNSYKQ
ncbi:MAG: MliC family protein [Campylobacteraceae bacterium]|jgi:membrane-bound inhibitor of C-type lysozyme|nr:MliC family protein [Campylobacteraceae bacterium]